MTHTPESSRHLGIFISMFPEMHETFILRELVALERRGVPFTVYSLQHPRDPITLEDAKRLSSERTVYADLVSFAAFMAFVGTLIRHPIKLLGAMATFAWVGRDRPLDVIKGLGALPLILQFGSHARRQGITHLHGHWANVPTTACWFLQRVMGFNWSAAIHGEDIFSANRFLPYKLDQATFSVVCSGYFCKHLKTEIGVERPESIHLNYHGLDPKVMALSATTAFNMRAASDPFRIVSIGRLVPTKGHDTLFRACAAILARTDTPLTIDLIGAGPDHDRLQALARELGIEQQVNFVGALPFESVLESLVQANAFCLAPRMIPGHPPDGIPNVIAEAMALRVPIVTTAVSAIPELVENGESGLLAPDGDTDAFAQAIETLMNDPQRAQALSDAGYDKVGIMFNQEANIDDLLSLFHEHNVLPRAA